MPKPARDPLKPIERAIEAGDVLDAGQLAALAGIRREALDRADRAIAASYAAVRRIDAARADDPDQPTDSDLARTFGVTPQMVYKWQTRPGGSARPQPQEAST